MQVEAVELRQVRLPLVRPFVTASGAAVARSSLLVRVLTDQGEGWGECAALEEPLYTSEYVDAAEEVTRRHLVPRLLGAGEVGADDVARLLRPVQGHPMAKAAVEMAVLDAELRAAGRSLAWRLGATRPSVDCGVAVGFAPTLAALLDEVGGYLDEGYRRVKLKIHPGADLEPVAAVRERFGDVALQVDANGAYAVEDWPRLAALDPFDLLLVEQPVAVDDLLGAAEVARRIRTPVCLDESITSASSAATALALGACSVVNVKPGRVGGLLEAVRIHDLCLAAGVPVWCGGMLETGLGRAANLALAGLPGFTLPGDLSGSARYFTCDLTDPFVPEAGRLRVPTGPGLGVAPLPDALRELTTSVELLRR
ncbi:MAG: o-succinylbenzoate synthase [Acidimicrobiales bacterium]